MANGNQWMDPAFYKSMTNEQVDWANLAQQWIKMKETSPAMAPGQQVKMPPFEHNLVKLGQHIEPQNPSNIASVTNKMLGNNIEKPKAWNTWTWQQQQQWNWASSSTAPSNKAPIIESVNSPPMLSEPPPYFPMMTPNKPFLHNNYWAAPNSRVLPPTESDQWNKISMISNVDSRTQDPSFIDAAKRKQLPAWIREGLEKMEREKRRKIEQEQSFDAPDYSHSMNENITQELSNLPNNFDQETQLADVDIEHVSSDYINTTEPRKTEFVKNDPSPIIPRKTKAQIWEDTMLNLRKILTKLLMDVTNDMMLSVVKEVLKTALQTDIQGNQNQTSLAGKLGLGVYGSESESSDESDKEQHISGHKHLKQDSDEDIQERILKRQREFSNIEARILTELDQLEAKEKLVRSKFDNSIKLNEEINDNGSQVVENIQTKVCNGDEQSSKKMNERHDKIKKELTNDLIIKNEKKKKKSKTKRSSSSSSSSRSSDTINSVNTDNKYSFKKNDKIKSKFSNKKTPTVSVKRKRRSRSRNRSRAHSISKRSRSHSRHSSKSRSKHYDKRSPHSFRSRRSRSPLSRHSYSRKHKSKRNSSSSSNESKNNKHRYRR
ncbi:arginine/serine-rich protein PNISR-like isoform X2 [Rhopalosiphum padi]|uniref:arginine/serine-rich protein PNISR-like isoform X2 n=1 Tax=Rhopalosiphum padi TaxID=40932 RepID=UPI00298EAA34|nr:arginine/serine-rich protein PNISR-like isoform X2 [Rhopalosiphum padi]